MNNKQAPIPPTPHGGAAGGRRMPPPQSTGRGGGFPWSRMLLILVIIVGVTDLIAPVIIDIASASGNPGSIRVENIFIDIDNDGDQDFIERADVLFNCAGQLCLPATPTASAPAASELAPPPTPVIYQEAPDD